jgi:hypothetical protein
MTNDIISDTVNPITLGTRSLFEATGVSIDSSTGAYLVSADQVYLFSWTADAAGTAGYANDFSSLFMNDTTQGFVIDDSALTVITNLAAFENTVASGALFETTSFGTPGLNLTFLGAVQSGPAGSVTIENVHSILTTAPGGLISSSTDPDAPAFPAPSPAQVTLVDVDSDWTQSNVGGLTFDNVILSIQNSAITNSLSQNGAGLNVYANSVLDTTLVQNTNFQCNENYDGAGGNIAVYLTVPAPVTINTDNVLGGCAEYGAGILVVSTSATPAPVSVANSAIFSNENDTANAFGAGVYVTGNINLAMTGDVEIWNDAIFTDNGTLTTADATTAQFYAANGANVAFSGGEYSVLSPASYAGATVTFANGTVYGSASSPFNLVYSIQIDWNYADGIPSVTFGMVVNGMPLLA